MEAALGRAWELQLQQEEAAVAQNSVAVTQKMMLPLSAQLHGDPEQPCQHACELDLALLPLATPRRLWSSREQSMCHPKRCSSLPCQCCEMLEAHMEPKVLSCRQQQQPPRHPPPMHPHRDLETISAMSLALAAGTLASRVASSHRHRHRHRQKERQRHRQEEYVVSQLQHHTPAPT